MSATAYEQLMMELINRARLDPVGEAALLGLNASQLGLPKGSLDPLAGSFVLADAAEDHSRWMLQTDTFSHTGAGGTSAGERIEGAGYIFATGDTWAENIALWGTSGTLNQTSATQTMHANLFESDGHRANLLSKAVTQVGVAIERGDYYGYDTGMTTQNFASAGGTSFLTGVVYDDTDDNAFYSVGEGRAGVGIRITGHEGVSASAGGYSVALGASGDQQVSIFDGSKTTWATVSLDGGNVKLDLVNGDTLMTTADLSLGSGGRNATALGIQKIDLNGNAAGNILIANDAGGLLNGKEGDDILYGGDGNDLSVGGKGHDLLEGGKGRDSLLGHSGDDVIHGDGDNDRMKGGVHHDELHGGWGDDAILGNQGRDQLFGGHGDDFLNGGYGQDTLTGGAGADVFYFKSYSGRDQITDFETGVDHIRFAESGVAYADLTFTQTADGVRVEWRSVDILLEGLTTDELDPGDFLFG